MALPQFVLLPKKSELPKIFSGAGGRGLFFPFCLEGQKGKGCLIHLLYSSSARSPKSVLLSDSWKHKRAFRALHRLVVTYPLILQF